VNRSARRRKSVVVFVMSSLVTFALGLTAAVFVARPAAASGPATTTTATTAITTDPNSPAAKYLVINGTVSAASDHEIVGSSAFPNYTSGAVDNYYSLAKSHVDNSPFAEGTASPADTGPVGQTAAAGNTQQPQYADARWPGDSGTATYGSKGGPYAVANATDYSATAEASEASSDLNGTTPVNGMAVPRGFDGRLRLALATWKAKWLGRLTPKKATPPAPTVTVTTPVLTVTTPSVGVGSVAPPPVPVPSVPVQAPSVPGLSPKGAAPSRSLQDSSSADGASLLASSTKAALDKNDALVTSGESSLGRVSIGGGQIVLDGIHVVASITNDGTPAYKAAVTVASASIGGVPVTIDQDGVHVSGQGQALPYQQASDALNGALKQAGIQLFLVSPEVTKSSCGASDASTQSAPTTSTPTTTTSSNKTTTTSPSSPGLPGQTDTTSTTTAGSGCGGMYAGMPAPPGAPSWCGGFGTSSDTGTTGTTTTSGLPGAGLPGQTTTNTNTTTTTTTTTTSSTGGTDTTSCGDFGQSTPTTCPGTGTTSSTTTSSTETTSTTPAGMGTDSSNGSVEETVTATGVHVVFTQPVNQSGVPAQYVEHILGEVFVDSLATPATTTGDLAGATAPTLGLCSSTSKHSGGKKHSGAKASGVAAAHAGGSSGGGSAASGSGSSLGSSSSSQPTSSLTAGGSSSEPTSASTTSGQQQSIPARFVAALHKPMWLLLAYLVWQGLMIATGVGLWRWHRGATS
jgi:hypothetical protein